MTTAEGAPHTEEHSAEASAPTGPGSGPVSDLPAQVGRYRVVSQLGEGAMGRVYRALDPSLGRDVAVKVLRADLGGPSRANYEARFRNEARAAARFDHPHVVAVHDMGDDPEAGPFVVYEFVAGRTLREALESSPLSPAEIVRVARGVASALGALHAAGIVHRDIKPDNVMLGDSGAVKITDFGIARVPDAVLTRDGQFLGTPAYAPPEAITRGEYAPAGDVFSLGAVLYEALTGMRPFPGEDAVSVSYAVVHDPHAPPSRVREGLPAGVDAVFARALAKRPEDRYTTAAQLSQALCRALGERLGRSRGASGDTELPRGLVPALLVLLVAIVGAVVFSRRPQPVVPVEVPADAAVPDAPVRSVTPRGRPHRPHRVQPGRSSPRPPPPAGP